MTERKALKNIYEIWAGSEGIPVPETAVEAYLLRLIEQMRDEASKALAKRQWVGLTEDEVTDCWRQSKGYGKWEEFAKAIEAKLREKNT